MAHVLNTNITSNSFVEMANYKYFVDKSLLIGKLNEKIRTPDKYICVTRPRRFGKTVNAMMLACYYSKNASFKNLFDKLEISNDPSYLEHLNKYNVIYLTFSEMPKINCTYEEFLNSYILDLLDDLKENFPEVTVDRSRPIFKVLGQVYEKYGERVYVTGFGVGYSTDMPCILKIEQASIDKGLGDYFVYKYLELNDGSCIAQIDISCIILKTWPKKFSCADVTKEIDQILEKNRCS